MVSEREDMDHAPDGRSRAALLLAKAAFLIVKLTFMPLVLLVLAVRAIIRRADPRALPTQYYKLDRAGGEGGRS